MASGEAARLGIHARCLGEDLGLAPVARGLRTRGGVPCRRGDRRPGSARTIRTVEHLWIPLADGCRLAARLWLPEDADPVPAVLDAVPYRLGDGTAAGDAAWMRYFAGHGYAGVRIDLRGSGNSDGLIADEYSAQEAADVDEVIAWLAAQPWCTGAVGMIGVSWGGFAALQAAARRPPALRGIVPIHASDDRYADDVHYFGGCVLGHRHAALVDLHGRLSRPAARPGGGRGRLARALARAAGGHGAVGGDLARAPAP